MILLTGGSGRLGVELQKLRKFDAPSHDEYDITDNDALPRLDSEMVIHAAAFTNVDVAEIDPNRCIKVNVGGTALLAMRYQSIPFVFISSEHAHNAVNLYSGSKYAAEEVVKAIHPHHLIVRTLFKPNPYPFDNAWTDQITQGDYVDIIAKLTLEAIDAWDKKTSDTIYVGTGRKSIFELAQQTRPDVKPSSRLDHPGAAKRAADYE